jgi:hypothetical protein
MMKEIIELLEKAIKEADRVEVLGVWDREHLNRSTSCVKKALEELYGLNADEDVNKEAS